YVTPTHLEKAFYHLHHIFTFEHFHCEEMHALWCDVFSNLFGTTALDPIWRTSTVLGIARQMYESRDFSAMPILADALQDADCENDEVLRHCREPVEHVR